MLDIGLHVAHNVSSLLIIVAIAAFANLVGIGSVSEGAVVV